MSKYRKIVWNEGMLLTPHHFQQWDNYHEDLLQSRIGSVAPYSYGILDLKINNEAIANANFQITRCRAVMPDGLVVNVPDVESVPDLRPVGDHFHAEAEKLGVHLAIPAMKAGEANFQSNGAKASATLRYLQEGALVKDETSGTNEQPLAYTKNNLRIIFDDELRDGFTSIKIAELERTPTGQVRISDEYIPPTLNASSSVWLGDMMRQFVEILITKSGSLGEQRRQRQAGLADFTTSDTGVFWLLHTINSSIPAMSHFFYSSLVHPERLYLEMAGLVGKLMTFSTDFHPRDIVKYDHDDLYFTFFNLAGQLRDLLETVIPSRCVAIPLEKTRETLYVGRVEDERLLKDAAFYLAVRSQIPESKVIDGVPRVVKIASRDVIDSVIGSALPGVVLTYTNPPPAPIPARVGFKYFQLDSIGPYWDGIKGSKVVSVYVPDEITDVKLEMYAVKP
ncbi:MAG TPA: type VI secretion system baseplate subunit TssK [Pyrinomonadaceae bacterium]|nr:type VI secretion system baseplate subunit TssK [Chloracidobacterium sp.]MBP9935477.1 type VI secretion system baseplate subunit TssK [Pyrinomonadaceae bacterium]MBL0242213.1 type VI secretion system baseplate subunit TssK [Chloracidobacterium sp.]HQX54832.1 type VI secretion system baseplate subunit TssK [Pyrinomonadaceae bacterium]HQY67953.1 type VI secretion system baseplate subunit TssK [Pyrinomonadaceae bacterium]